MPGGVSASVEGAVLSVKGPKGTLSMPMIDDIDYGIEDGRIVVKPANETKRARSFWGMHRTLVQNLVTGVTDGFTKVLEITGVGYRAAAQGKTLKLQLGYSHDVNYAIPDGIEVKTPDATTIEISGIDRQQVGQVAAEIRRWRKPEPYKGKGIKYRGEYIFRKEGKKK
ncbi:50S ribosomal protein L6 [Sphingomonas sp.]|uniref:50S ribosomal protein L6 n=1 Tax=Sphingomonas sp. TaxID=28214 RepID=UPI00286E343F|nr:50S ribosomal protein L6 [Sphingomonas sp.]